MGLSGIAKGAKTAARIANALDNTADGAKALDNAADGAKAVKAAVVTMPNGSKLPAPGKGKGTVPPAQRDPKRVATKSEKQEMLNERGGKCEGCDKSATVEDVQAHHTTRYADGGRTEKKDLVNLCPDCHNYVHKNGQK